MGRKHRKGELEAVYFNNLPQRCKEMLFEFLDMDDIPAEKKILFFKVSYFGYEDCESPIEQIFNFAFDLLTFCDKDPDIDWFFLINQQEVKIEDKRYRIDLMIDTDECENPFVKFKPYKLAIECDGHEFHEKTKEQVRKRNQRDLDLKKNGIDVIHFSGSQIFNDPFGCAKQVIEYLKLNLVVVGGDNNREGLDIPTPKDS